MRKRIHPYIRFALFVFIFSAAFSAEGYVQCEDLLPDELLDHAALTDQSDEDSLHLSLFTVLFVFPGMTVSLPSQGVPRLRSLDSSVPPHSVLSTVIRT